MKGEIVIPRRASGFEVAHRIEGADHHFEIATGSSFSELYWDVPAKQFVADPEKYADLPQILEAEGATWLLQLLPSLAAENDHWSRSFDEMLLKGVVDQAMFGRFADAHRYDAASTVGWLHSRLAVLLGRIRDGRSLSLFSPHGQVAVSTVDEFKRWAHAYFPGANI